MVSAKTGITRRLYRSGEYMPPVVIADPVSPRKLTPFRKRAIKVNEPVLLKTNKEARIDIKKTKPIVRYNGSGIANIA
jgi:hypothetical protein